jgi:hypothetical protein
VARWFDTSFFNIIDIQTQGWRHEVKPSRVAVSIGGWLLVIGLAVGWWRYELSRLKTDSYARWRTYLLGLSIFGILTQLFVNFGKYRESHIFGLVLNGRYTIPSLLLIVGFGCYYWCRLLARYPKTRAIITILAILFVIFGSGLLMMLRNPQLRLG